MVLKEVQPLPDVNPVLPSPPEGFKWPKGVGWEGSFEEAELFMVRADSQRVYSQIVDKQVAAREARENGQ